ncbi:hypothetical protein HD806DRAFT_542082 [Xylariaceae sp. AK1471]|nr:hypothetical protein HD806DRAFT_542082 [Xylariaceae sp. AK1471]
MDFIRTNVLRRGQPQEGQMADLEQQRPTTDVQGQTQNGSRLFTMTRPAIPSLFTGRSSLIVRGQRPNEYEPEEDDGPKSPAPNRFRLPSLARSRTHDTPNQVSSSEDDIQGSEAPSQPPMARIRTRRFPVLARPPTTRTTGEESERHVSRSRFNGSDPAELHLVNLAESGRRRQRRHHRRGNSDGSRRQQKEPPNKFLFCFPWVKSRRARALILRCFVSGIFLISMLTIYLSLSITKNINTSEFSILLILLILLTTIFFCHGLVRLCMLLVAQRNPRGNSGNQADANGHGPPGGYAIPRRPIRVVLARDEEAAGIESETSKLTPPAYGLWRESVRVDPDRIYWQRAESPKPSLPTSASSTTINEEDRPRTGQHRPPSYASDDGIDYIIEARPRSIAPPPSGCATPTNTPGSERACPADGSWTARELVNGLG